MSLSLSASLTAQIDASPTIVQNAGSSGAPTSNAYVSGYPSVPGALDLGLIATSCNSAQATPTSSGGTWTPIFASNHVATNDYFGLYSKVLNVSDQTQIVGCSGVAFAYALTEVANAATPNVGSLTTGGTGTNTTGSVSITVASSNCLLIEYYEAHTQSVVTQGITDSPPSGQTTVSGANSGTIAINSQTIYSFYNGVSISGSATDPFTATQPYTNSATWAHNVAAQGALDVYICPSVLSSPSQWLPYGLFGVWNFS